MKQIITGLLLIGMASASWAEEVWYCTQNQMALASPNSIFNMPSNERFTVYVNREEGSLRVGEPHNRLLNCLTINCKDEHGGNSFIAAISHESEKMSWTNYFGLNIKEGSFQTFFEHSKAAGMTVGTCETF